jgi:hypothetical protein
LSGSANPAFGEWHEAQDCPFGSDNWTLKNSFLPSDAFALSGGAATPTPVNVVNHIAQTVERRWILDILDTFTFTAATNDVDTTVRHY